MKYEVVYTLHSIYFAVGCMLGSASLANVKT